MASQQPPAGRNWFRLASLARMEAASAATAAQTPATPPVPRIAPPRPPQQPPPPPEAQIELPPQLQQPEIKEQTSLPPPPPPPRQPSPPVPRMATPPESPKVVVHSYAARPPSPTAEQQKPEPDSPPKRHPEPEPGTKVQPQTPPPKTITVPEESKSNNLNGRRVSQKVHDSMAESSSGKPTTWKVEEGKELRVLTMAGENAGAIMELRSAAQGRRLGHGSAGKVIQGNVNEQRKTVEDNDKKRDEKDKASRSGAKTKPMTAVVNSNVQSINNSVVLNSNCSQHSPGVHFSFASHRRDKDGVGSPRH